MRGLKCNDTHHVIGVVLVTVLVVIEILDPVEIAAQMNSVLAHHKESDVLGDTDIQSELLVLLCLRALRQSQLKMKKT